MTKIKANSTMSSAIKEAHNYHEWIFESFKPFIKKGNALEVGSGHGIYSKKIAQRVSRLFVTDIDGEALENIRKELNGYDNVEFYEMDGIELEKFSSKVENIILINILEHINDDELFIEKCWELLEEDGHLIIFVPAFMFLFSHMDKAAGHFRRYTKKTLSKLVQKYFIIQKVCFFNKIGFWGWLANKYLKSGMNANRTNMQISIFDRFIPVLKHFDYLLPFFGQSILLLATRKK